MRTWKRTSGQLQSAGNGKVRVRHCGRAGRLGDAASRMEGARKGPAEPMGPGRWNSIAREQGGDDEGGDSGILGRGKLCKQKTQMEIEESAPRKDRWPHPGRQMAAGAPYPPQEWRV